MIRFNQSWCIQKPLPNDSVVGLPTLRVRDVSLGAVSKHLGQYQDVVERLCALLHEQKYTLVSITNEFLQPGTGTCLDTGWHLDGRMVQDAPEHYALVCFGDDGARTMFCDVPFSGQIPVAPTTQEGRQQLFGRLMQRDLENEAGGFEIPNGAPITYTTFDFHKGRRVLTAGRRILIRVMTSNLIRPKPFSLR